MPVFQQYSNVSNQHLPNSNSLCKPNIGNRIFFFFCYLTCKVFIYLYKTRVSVCLKALVCVFWLKVAESLRQIELSTAEFSQFVQANWPKRNFSAIFMISIAYLAQRYLQNTLQIRDCTKTCLPSYSSCCIVKMLLNVTNYSHLMMSLGSNQ